MIDQPLKVGVGLHPSAMTAINFPKYSSGEAWRLFRGVLIGRHSRTGEQKQELQDWSSRILRGLQADGPAGPPTSGRKFA